jgi:hypothetical protein
VTLKKTLESREHANEELIASSKKDRDHYKLKWEAEKRKNKLVDLTIEEESQWRKGTYISQVSIHIYWS